MWFYFILSIILVWQAFKFIKRRFTKITFLNQTVWITGASSGIGEHLAYRFAKYGANLILTARNVEKLEKVRNACLNPDKVTILPLELSKPEEAAKQAEEFLKSKSIKIDILVNNAGAVINTMFLDTPHEIEMEILNTNYVSSVMLARLVLPDMLKEKSGQIVLIESVAGKFGIPLRSAYCGSKFAMRGFFDAVRAEYSDQGLKVTSISPGAVYTDISKNERVGASGNKFGHDEKRIHKGQDVEKFADKSIRSIFFQDEDVVFTPSYVQYLCYLLADIWPELVFKIMASKKDKYLQERNEAAVGKFD